MHLLFFLKNLASTAVFAPEGFALHENLSKKNVLTYLQKIYMYTYTHLWIACLEHAENDANNNGDLMLLK